MKAKFFSLFVAASMIACGTAKPTFIAGTVVDGLKPAFLKLARETSSMAHYDMLAVAADGKGWAIKFDKAELDTINKTVKDAMVMGHTDGEKETITMIANGDVSCNGWCMRMEAENQASILAHELGHAMGLQHVDSGLMQPNVSQYAPSCNGHEAQCLIEALKDQGLLN